MLLRMRGIFSVPARSFIGMTTARMGTPLGTSRVFGTARAARVFGTARTARVFGTARTARVFGTVPAARVFGTAWAAVFFAVRFARALFAARPYRTLRVLVYISFEAVVLTMPEFPVRIAPVARMIAPIIRREPFGMPAVIVAHPSAIRLSPFRVVRVHPIGMVPMPPPIVVIGAFVRSAPSPKRIRFPERRPEPVRVMFVVVPPPIPPFHHPFGMMRIHPLGIIAMPPFRAAPNVMLVVIAEMLPACVLSHRRRGHQRASYGTHQ